jgi:hypothetical protein
VLSYATAGTGSTAHIAGAMLERVAGIKLLSVPYKGGAQAVTDVLAGNVSIYFSGIPPSIGHVKAGKLTALGIAGTRPVASLPNVPPFATGAWQRLDSRGSAFRAEGHAKTSLRSHAKPRQNLTRRKCRRAC